MPDELLLYLLQLIKWDSLQEAEILALCNQAATYPYQTPAAEYIRRQLLTCSNAPLLPRVMPAPSDHVAYWWDSPEDAERDTRTYTKQDLQLRGRNVLRSKGITIRVELEIHAGRARPWVVRFASSRRDYRLSNLGLGRRKLKWQNSFRHDRLSMLPCGKANS